MVNICARNRSLVGYAIITISALFLLPALGLGRQPDVALYQTVAENLFKGEIPYRDTVVEYPPYAILIFVLPRLIPGDYLNGFFFFFFLTDWGLKLLLLFIGLKNSKTLRALLPLCLYCVAALFTRFVFLQRYDIFPAVICVAGIWLFSSGRYAWSGLAIAVGSGLKLYPMLFVPPLFFLSVGRGKWKQFTVGVIGGLLPIVLLSFFVPWWRFAEFHASRGLQVESLYSSVLWLGKLLGLTEVQWAAVRKWLEIDGASASTILPWTRVLFIVTVISSTALVSWVGLRVSFSRFVFPPKSDRVSVPAEQQRGTSLSVSQLSQLLLLPLLAFVVFNQVFSPQYMIWLLPLAALASLEGNPRSGFAISLATFLTPIIYPSLIGNYATGLNLIETIVLLARNLILVVVWILLVRECFFLVPRRIKPD